MSKDFIQTQIQDGIAIVSLQKGVTNAIDGDIVIRFSEALAAAENDPQLRVLVLTSANSKLFSIGFDIPSLYHLPRDVFAGFYSAFNRVCMQLYSLPKPGVAAIPGHAIAGGCILALCCDRRIIADGHKLMGLNEVKLGVPVPFLAECIIRQLISGRDAREVLEAGEFYLQSNCWRWDWWMASSPKNACWKRQSILPDTLEFLPQNAYTAVTQPLRGNSGAGLRKAQEV